MYQFIVHCVKCAFTLNCSHIYVGIKKKYIFMQTFQAAKRRQLSAIEASRLQDITRSGSVLLTVVTVISLCLVTQHTLPIPATVFTIVMAMIYTFYLLCACLFPRLAPHCTLHLEHVFPRLALHCTLHLEHVFPRLPPRSF